MAGKRVAPRAGMAGDAEVQASAKENEVPAEGGFETCEATK